MKTIKLSLLSIIGFLLIISNLYSQSKQLDELLKNHNKLSPWGIEIEMRDRIFGDKAFSDKSISKLSTKEYKPTSTVDSAIVLLEDGSKVKYSYSYNSNGKMTSMLVESWDGSQWTSYERWTANYNPNNNRVWELFESWEFGEWVGVERWTYTFDSNGNKTFKLQENWEYSQWVNYAQWFYTNNPDGTLATYFNQWWNYDSWENAYRYTYTRDVNGNTILMLAEWWHYIEWENSQRYTYTYDSNGNITSHLDEYWDPIYQWVNYTRSTYTYDSNGNMTLYFWEFWEYSQWVNKSRLTYTYDSNGNRTLYLWEVWYDSQWVNNRREAYTYDSNGNMISELTENWDGSLWVNSFRKTYTYDSNGNIILWISEGWYNGNWVASDDDFYFYDFSFNNIYSIWGAEIHLYYDDSPLKEIEIGEVVEYAGQFSTLTDGNEVKFTKVFGKENLEIEAEIWEVKEDTIRFLLPCDLIFSKELFLEKIKDGVTAETVIFEITTNKGQPNEITITDSLIWILPKLLIYDQVVNPPVAIHQQILPQYDLIVPYPQDVSSFFFLGKSVDELVGLRTLNTAMGFPPLTLDMKVGIPGRGEVPPFQQFNEGQGNKGIHFNVAFDSLYCICVFQEKNVTGSFPSPFQIHLAGNVGNPRKLINGKPEFPRGIRQDILFNHPAPRPQQLLKYHTKKSEGAETALFKFTNIYSVNPYAVAVLIPPNQSPEGMRLGGAYKRAADPNNPVSITTPTAMTEALNPSFPGSLESLVIDFTQLPYPVPPDALNVNTFWNNTVAAVIGNNTKSVSLPLTSNNNIKSIICDMGSGNEIYNGAGNDFQVLISSGSYEVAVSNTPFAETFVPIGNTHSGTQQFDLAPTKLSSARYVRIIASPSVAIEAVAALNMYLDVTKPNVGPVVINDRATMMMQRVKAYQTDINPFLQLIDPDGQMNYEDPGGFGDVTNTFLTDALLKERPLGKEGYYRFLAKGYDKRPTSEAFGTFHVRLETSGDWDPNDINVSNSDEVDTNPQKNGNFSRTRERDSYLFQAQPGQRIGMSVKSLDANLNPILELYDPEGFLIAANDDYPKRGKNPVIALNLPTTSFYSDSALPNPSTYRIVVGAIDKAGNKTTFENVNYFQRQTPGGSYELRVFTGILKGEQPGVVDLVWDAPSSGETLAPPTNLIAQLGGGNLLKSWNGQKQNAIKIERKHSSTHIKPHFKSNMPQADITEIEPNNSPDQAQVLTGAQLIMVNGNAEVDDIGTLVISDDIEDLFKITTYEDGLNVFLEGFTSDCDLYLLDTSGAVIIESAFPGASQPEGFYDEFLPSGTYLIGVSINDSDPIGGNTTPYVLALIGEFEGGGESNLLSYNVYRSTSPNAMSTGTLVGNIDVGTTSHTDPPPFVGEFYYQVTAVYDQGESTPSNDASVTVTRIGDEPKEKLPNKFKLFQNYPNPFNPTTTISFKLPERSNVKLTVYNILGKKVKTIINNQEKDSGLHKVIFSGKDLASGIYFVRMTAGSFTDIKKIMLLK